MMKSVVTILLTFAFGSEAFTVQRPFLVASVNSISQAQQVRRFMSDGNDTKKTKKDGNVYDDEVAPYKSPISESMKERLLREASTGLDSEKPQTNVILYVSIAVAILALLGGQGIFY